MEGRDASPSAGFTRRDLIKRAAAAGAVAWTAPVVIGSLASPAGAVTGPAVSGCHITLFNNQCSPTNQGTPCNSAAFPAGCVPNSAIAPCLSVTSSVSGNCQQNVTVTISVNTSLCPGCQIVYAEAKAGSDCVAPQQGFPNQTSTFPPISSPGYAQFAVALQCP